MPINFQNSFQQYNYRLRICLFYIDIALFIFWIYSIAYIVHHPAAKGSDGFEIFLAVPMTMIALFLSLPALLLLISSKTTLISALVTLIAMVMNGIIGSDVLWNSGLRHGNFWPLW